jgi:hypothetical protein
MPLQGIFRLFTFKSAFAPGIEAAASGGKSGQ